MNSRETFHYVPSVMLISSVIPIVNQWRTEGGGLECSNPLPPRNSEGPTKNRAKLNPIVKTVKKNC